VLTWSSKYFFNVGVDSGIYALTTKAVPPESEVHAFESVNRFHLSMIMEIWNDEIVEAVEKVVKFINTHITL